MPRGLHQVLRLPLAPAVRQGQWRCCLAVLSLGLALGSVPSGILSPSPTHQHRRRQAPTALWEEAQGAEGTCPSETKWVTPHHIGACWGGAEEAGRHPQIEDSIYEVYRVHWAKLQLVLPEFPAPYGPVRVRVDPRSNLHKNWKGQMNEARVIYKHTPEASIAVRPGVMALLLPPNCLLPLLQVLGQG